MTTKTEADVLSQTSAIVASYVANNNISVERLSNLLGDVHRALTGAGNGAAASEAPRPAAPIGKSVQPDHVVCLECGERRKMLRRHLRNAHGLTPADYRSRWNLAPDHPLVAPNYARQRGEMVRRRSPR